MKIILKLNRTELDHLFHNLILLRTCDKKEYEVEVDSLPDTSKKDTFQERIKQRNVTPFGIGEIPTG